MFLIEKIKIGKKYPPVIEAEMFLEAKKKIWKTNIQKYFKDIKIFN